MVFGLKDVVKKQNSNLRIAERTAGSNFNNLDQHSEHECIDAITNTHDLSHLWNLKEVEAEYQSHRELRQQCLTTGVHCMKFKLY